MICSHFLTCYLDIRYVCICIKSEKIIDIHINLKNGNIFFNMDIFTFENVTLLPTRKLIFSADLNYSLSNTYSHRILSYSKIGRNI